MGMTTAAVSGLVTYVRSVTSGLGEFTTVDFEVEESPATVLILLSSRVPTLPDCPLLLTWDEVSGWALRVETDGEGETTPVSYLGEDVLPRPTTVQQFLRAALRGESPGSIQPHAFRRPNAPDDLENRLEHFQDAEHH
ncbi:DUF6292 family protein [Saccharopolyspora flava]|uniref:DUF6292 domain-containing protein n=1 Tax=Saccharopolyspora flava TaxID=95161 RepID=A0A1I6TNH7_9PSEU|nr:DUF6292 family protein [Saccharopolyspora flava]SFS90773.1 hypothetical protein SAMN05660874_04133 [Saccharopolyspora flava]